MGKIKRINPRRPWHSTAQGIRRIVLAAPPSVAIEPQAKPVRTPANPNAWLLAIVHSERGALDDHVREAIAAAAILAEATTGVAVLVLGELNENLADAGADRVLVAADLGTEYFQPEVELACVEAVIAKYQPVQIFMPDNAYGTGDLGRRVIAKQKQKSAATHVVELSAEHVAILQQGGRQLARYALPDCLLAKDAVDSKLPFTGLATCEAAPVVSEPTAYQDLGVQHLPAEEIDLEEADRIISAGNGVQQIATLQNLAQLLEASVGASRVAVDDGKLPRSKQIGATGKTVSASTYIAVGISGAIQHLQGIKDCRHVIAINRDAGAPIVKRSNLSVIDDAEMVMQSLTQLIQQAKEAPP